MNRLATHLSALRHFSPRLLLSSLLHALGIVWFLVESSAFFFPKFAVLVKSLWWLFPIAGGLIGFRRAWPRLSVQGKIKDVVIEVRVCDMFAQDSALIIGSNMTFDTSMENETIHESSTQGQFTKRFYQSIDLLDLELHESLTGSPFRELSEAEKPYGKRQEYEVGTVAAVKGGGKRAYFVAIAKMNEHGNASAGQQDILDALPRLWEFIRTRGGLDPLCCPILGSGFSRVTPAMTKEELIREIIKSFVAAATASKFCDKLVIAVSPTDFRKGAVNLESVGRFLEQVCLYSGGL